jgi:MoaA/NifB/PqqE/SkfB family radical SAM enzyme
MVSNTTLPAIEYLHRMGTKKISLSTNGSGRNPQWWSDLAKTMIGKNDYVVFAIDGLDDTNHLYRRNTNWEVIMQSVNTFIKAGGRAIWSYLVFEHNQHQVEKANSMAEKLGFVQFQPKATSRFAAYSLESKENQKQITAKSSKGESLYTLRPSSNPKYQNSDVQRLPSIIKMHGSLSHYYQNTNISCQTQLNNSIFISFEAEIWPCCWTALRKYQKFDNPSKAQILELSQRYGTDFNCLRTYTVEEVLNNQWFSSDLSASWSCNRLSDNMPAKLQVCARHCGKEFNPSASQYL